MNWHSGKDSDERRKKLEAHLTSKIQRIWSLITYWWREKSNYRWLWVSVSGNEVSKGVINLEKKYGGKTGWGNGEKDNRAHFVYFWDISGIFRGSYFLRRLKWRSATSERSKMCLRATMKQGMVKTMRVDEISQKACKMRRAKRTHPCGHEHLGSGKERQLATSLRRRH